MDPILKQRVVGVIVITALAAIFVPMLFDDPVEDDSKMISELAIPDAPMDGFQSSVQKLPRNTEQVLELPPPESLKVEPEPQTLPNKVEEPKTTAAQPAAEKKPQTKQSNSLQRWVVQVGSFSQKPKATTLRNTLRGQGFSAFVETFTAGNNATMYRVRVGPELDRQRAEAMQKKINTKNNLRSIVVSE